MFDCIKTQNIKFGLILLLILIFIVLILFNNKSTSEKLVDIGSNISMMQGNSLIPYTTSENEQIPPVSIPPNLNQIKYILKTLYVTNNVLFTVNNDSAKTLQYTKLDVNGGPLLNTFNQFMGILIGCATNNFNNVMYGVGTNRQIYYYKYNTDGSPNPASSTLTQLPGGGTLKTICVSKKCIWGIGTGENAGWYYPLDASGIPTNLGWKYNDGVLLDIFCDTAFDSNAVFCMGLDFQPWWCKLKNDGTPETPGAWQQIALPNKTIVRTALYNNSFWCIASDGKSYYYPLDASGMPITSSGWTAFDTAIGNLNNIGLTKNYVFATDNQNNLYVAKNDKFTTEQISTQLSPTSWTKLFTLPKQVLNMTGNHNCIYFQFIDGSIGYLPLELSTAQIAQAEKAAAEKVAAEKVAADKAAVDKAAADKAAAEKAAAEKAAAEKAAAEKAKKEAEEIKIAKIRAEQEAEAEAEKLKKIKEEKDAESSKNNLYIGIGVGVGVLLLIIIGVIIFFVMKKKKSNNNSTSE